MPDAPPTPQRTADSHAPPTLDDPALARAGDTTPARDEAQPPVILRSIHKSFTSLTVLDAVSIEFQRGKTTVVLGPSGAGKSVLLKHIVGLLQPDKGQVLVEGQDVAKLNAAGLRALRRRIGYVFQLSALFDSMSVRENLEFPLIEHTNASKSERRRRVAESLELVDMAGFEARRPAELSGGQQRRVALARAIMLRPALMLYDEPTTGLDPVRAAGINDLIRRLQHELGVTSIVVTHDIMSAKTIGDRMILLRNATIAADGTLGELRRSPDPHVRNFLAGRYEPDIDEPPPTTAAAPTPPDPDARNSAPTDPA
ncbi:MAG: ABC transporter ATP-binding protein [Phycisphaerales bacterium]